MRIKTLLAGMAVAIAATFGAVSANASSLFVNFSDNASGYMHAGPGDDFYVNGQSGGVTLVSGVAQNVSALYLSESLGCCWDDAAYATTVSHTLTLNGVGGSFSQYWQVNDYIDPTTFINSAGPQVYNVTGGTITANMLGSSGFGYSQASLLFQSSGTPEPATWALMLSGFFGAGSMLRRRRQAAVAA